MKEKVDVFTEKRECSDLFAIAENKYRTEVSLYKDKKIGQTSSISLANSSITGMVRSARMIPPIPSVSAIV